MNLSDWLGLGALWALVVCEAIDFFLPRWREARIYKRTSEDLNFNRERRDG